MNKILLQILFHIFTFSFFPFAFLFLSSFLLFTSNFFRLHLPSSNKFFSYKYNIFHVLFHFETHFTETQSGKSFTIFWKTFAFSVTWVKFSERSLIRSNLNHFKTFENLFPSQSEECFESDRIQSNWFSTDLNRTTLKEIFGITQNNSDSFWFNSN